MKNIQGLSQEQTLEYLRAYSEASVDSLRWDKHHLCTFMFMKFISKRSRILPHEEKQVVCANIWQFIAYWYDRLGYGLPICSAPGSILFSEHIDQTLVQKINARKEFIERVINQIDVKIAA